MRMKDRKIMLGLRYMITIQPTNCNSLAVYYERYIIKFSKVSLYQHFSFNCGSLCLLDATENQLTAVTNPDPVTNR